MNKCIKFDLKNVTPANFKLKLKFNFTLDTELIKVKSDSESKIDM